MVRAKFTCNYVRKTKYAGGESHEVVLNPVTPYSAADTGENKAFWEASPTGKLELTITNKKAVAYFEPGKHYYIDFTEAPQEVPDGEAS